MSYGGLVNFLHPPMKTTKLLICAVAFAAAIVAVKANGQSLTTTYHGISPGLAIQGTWNGTDIYVVEAGEINFSGFDAFCVEPWQPIPDNEEIIYEIQDPASLGTAASGTISRLVGAYLASSRSNEDAAAIQWAIWETMTELDAEPNLLSGNSRITGSGDQDIANRANEYLSNINSFVPVTLVYLQNGPVQNVVSWNVIPEPTSVGLLVLSGLLVLRRRRN